MSDWKAKFINDLKNQKKLAEQQIELDKKCHGENVEKLKDINETLAKLDIKDKQP